MTRRLTALLTAILLALTAAVPALAAPIGFGDGHRQIIRSYYGDQLRHGRCPPGLAKKDNGCQAPGQAKTWRQGLSLPRHVPYFALPRELAGRLPPPPPGHQYVRVATDILLIAIGTRVVVDVIEDLGN